MEKKELIENIEFLYHLTSEENSEIILSKQIIESTVNVIGGADMPKNEKQQILRSRREGHLFVKNGNGQTIMIRDQNPISIKSLEKCLTDGWSSGDFIYHLNSRVFFWPNLSRLNIHFNKYQNENPVILKFRTDDLLELNDNIKLCHLNSGATRCHPKWGGAPPPRGAESFVKIEEFNQGLKRIAEVTFEGNCNIPQRGWSARHPNGPWIGI